jgi:hypothetical protein
MITRYPHRYFTFNDPTAVACIFVYLFRSETSNLSTRDLNVCQETSSRGIVQMLGRTFTCAR